MQLRTESGPIAEESAIGGGPFSLQSLRISRRARRLLAFASIAAAAYLAALVATIPAGLVAPRTQGAVLDGTIWRGEAALAGGNRLDWSWAPLRSLLQLGFAVDWQATGPATDLTGRALLKPGRAILEDIGGRADGALLRVIAPNLPFTCEMAMKIDLPRVVLGGDGQGFSGEVRSDPGACHTRDAGGLATQMPALIMVAKRANDRSTLATIAPLGERRSRLVKITLGGEGRLVVGVTPRGAAVLPFISPSGGMTIETDL